MGRHELLSWLNQYTHKNYTKMDQLADAVAYTELFNKAYPNNVRLHRLIRKCLSPVAPLLSP